MISELVEFITQHGLHQALVDRCACGMKNSVGEPLLKPWRFITSSASLASNLCSLRCPHIGIPGFKHGELSGGSETAKTAACPICLALVRRAYLECMRALAPPRWGTAGGGRRATLACAELAQDKRSAVSHAKQVSRSVEHNMHSPSLLFGSFSLSRG